MSKSKTIRVSEKVIKFLQNRMIPLSGTTASAVIEEQLGLNDDGESVLRHYWLIKTSEVGQVIAVDSPHKALKFAQGLKGVEVIPVREVKAV